jgi:peptidoglycan pentaglycine glycine transferase (the first glycine)
MLDKNWNDIITALPGAHILQTREWGELKACFGWEAYHLIWTKDRQGYFEYGSPGSGWLQTSEPTAAALVLTRTIRLAGFPLRVLYIPKGPLLNWEDWFLRQGVLGDLVAFANQKQAILLKIDPDINLGIGFPGMGDPQDAPLAKAILADLQQSGWHYSDEQIQFKNTVMIDLSPSEDELLAKMKQKTRYNLRLAERKGVVVRIGSIEDLPLLYQMYAETSVRDGFVIRDAAYYQSLWEKFIRAGMAEALIAEVDGQAVAALILFTFASKAWYLYGMSCQLHREKMPNYLLQWKAIQRAKSKGCLSYDMWGAPDRFDESDPMWGVYRFKEGLGGEIVRRIGAWDLPTRPTIYRLYTRTVPRILAMMRQRGQNRTRQQIGI